MVRIRGVRGGVVLRVRSDAPVPDPKDNPLATWHDRPMTRIHDVGGLHGFGTVPRKDGDEPPFTHEWEARVFAVNTLLLRKGVYNLDEFRHAIERMEPASYLASGYYERWLTAIETLLAAKGVL
jgi:nitrile hydratase subunit beta